MSKILKYQEGGRVMSNLLAVKERKEFKKSILHELRKEGYIPAVVYGRGEESKAISVKRTELFKTISEVGRNGVFSVKIDGNPRNVVLEDFQFDPIKKEIIHADFMYVNKSTELNAKVNVSLIGEASGVKEGGILQQSLHELNITAKPQDIPETIEVDVSTLKINDTIKVETIRDNYRKIHIRHENDEAIAVVLPPTVEEEAELDENQNSEV